MAEQSDDGFTAPGKSDSLLKDTSVKTTGTAEESHDDVTDDDRNNEEESDDAEEEEDEEDEEPKLKYARLTGNLGPVYRNGDATSAFLVAGDKMVCDRLPLDLLDAELSTVYRHTQRESGECLLHKSIASDNADDM